MPSCSVCLAVGIFLIAKMVSLGESAHGSISRELADMRNLIAGIDGKFEKVTILEKKLQNIERSLGSIIISIEELNRKSLLLREIHQDNDGRRELLQRISRAVEEMNRKHLASAGRKHKTEIERLDKLSENVQALFQIFGSISRKLDDLESKTLRTTTGGCLPNDFRLQVSRKLDSLLSTATLLNQCFECSKDRTLKDVFQPAIRHSLDNAARKLQLCTSSDVEKSLQRLFEPKFAGFLESLKNDISFKFRKFGSQLEGMKQECKVSDDDVLSKYSKMGSSVAAGDMAYSQDLPQDKGKSHKGGGVDAGLLRETPGRIFRKLWRKMTEPINKIGDKIEAIGHRLEVSNQRRYNQTISKFLELKTKPGVSDSCTKQVQTLEDTFKETAAKLVHIESRQIAVQNLCSEILHELGKVGPHVKIHEEDGIKITQSSKTGPNISNGSNREGHRIANSCTELHFQGVTKSGIYTIKPKNSTEEFLAYCDMETDGGGWTVFQRRGDYGETRQNFTQGWEAYKRGFGDFQREFWLGNEKIHLMTMQEEVKLRVELEDFEGNSAHAEYSRFKVEDESHQYRLTVGDYKGNATDSLSLHNGKLFSTEDRDNDEVSSCCNCADTFKGGWWYYGCFEANLNGPYHTVPTENGYFLGIIWERWKGDYSLKSSEMKLRPLTFEDIQDP